MENPFALVNWDTVGLVVIALVLLEIVRHSTPVRKTYLTATILQETLLAIVLVACIIATVAMSVTGSAVTFFTILTNADLLSWWSWRLTHFKFIFLALLGAAIVWIFWLVHLVVRHRAGTAVSG